MQGRRHSLENVAGKLLILRAAPRMDIADAQAIGAATRVHLTRLQHGVVALMDLRGMLPVSPDVAAFWVQVLKSDNPAVKRSGVIVDTATVGLQLERIVREAGSPARQCFREAGPCVAWLSEVMNDEERRALRKYLDEATA
jgi:hypothetical protein